MRGPSYTGRTLGGRYVVEELLGEGGWGAVYAGTQIDLGRKVALKILHVDVALTAEAVSRFEREAKTAASFGHPNIVQVTDFQMNPGEPPFLVMERLTGATLGSVLARQVVLPPLRVAMIAYQMLSALDVAHRAGLVHRDVKPDNVFLVSMPGVEDFVKLLDFGIAKLSAQNQAQLTGDGQMLGSPAFMSPEQVRSQPVDHRSDIYAVGATMYFALAGRLPFDATNVASLLAAIMEAKPAPLTSVAPSVDPRLGAIVDRALHKDPFGRFASAADMRAALEPMVHGGALGVTPATLESVPNHLAVGTTPKGMITTGGPVSSAVTSAPQGPAPHIQTGLMGTPAPHVGPSAERSSVGQIASPGFVAPPVGMSTPNAMMMPPQTHPSGVVYHPPPPQPNAGRGALIALIVVGVLAVLALLGVGGVLFLTSRDSTATTPTAPPTASLFAPHPPTTTTAAPPTTVTSATPTNTAGVIKPKPGPLPPTPTPPGPTPNVVADAGAPPIVVVDAGVPQAFCGPTARFSGGAFDKYDIEKGKESIARVQPQLDACFAATMQEPPNHEHTCWILTIDAAGNVTGVRRATNFDPHPRLDACVGVTFRASRWQSIPGGGAPQLCFASRRP